MYLITHYSRASFDLVKTLDWQSLLNYFESKIYEWHAQDGDTLAQCLEYLNDRAREVEHYKPNWSFESCMLLARMKEHDEIYDVSTIVISFNTAMAFDTGDKGWGDVARV